MFTFCVHRICLSNDFFLVVNGAYTVTSVSVSTFVDISATFIQSFSALVVEADEPAMMAVILQQYKLGEFFAPAFHTEFS